MTDTTERAEALRLADALDAEVVRTVSLDVTHSQAAALLLTQAERIASLEAERDRLRAEVERLREFFDADMAVSKVFDEVSPGLTSPPGTEWSDRADAAVARRCAAVISIESAKE